MCPATGLDVGINAESIKSLEVQELTSITCHSNARLLFPIKGSYFKENGNDCIYQFAMGAITNTIRLGGLNIFCTVLQSRIPRSRCGAGLVSLEASLLGLKIAAFLLLHHIESSVGMYAPDVSLCLNFLFYKNTSHKELGPPHTSSYYLNYPCKGPISKYSHLLRYWSLGLQHINFGGEWGKHNLAHNAILIIFYGKPVTCKHFLDTSIKTNPNNSPIHQGTVENRLKVVKYLM